VPGDFDLDSPRALVSQPGRVKAVAAPLKP